MENTAFTEALHVNVKSFNLTKAITDKNLFSKINLTPVARIIIFNLSNMYNPRLGYSFPGLKKLQDCTGYKERQLKSGLKELLDKNLIIKTEKKIYFTKKFYELLEIVENKVFSPEKANFAEENANNTSKSANFAFTCHEQKKEQIKKHFFENSFNLEKSQINNLLKKDSFLSNKQQAEIVLNAYHQHNVKENDLKTILQIQKVWNFKKENFNVLKYFEQRKNSDQIFKKKIKNLELEISGILEDFSAQINELREAWKEYNPENCFI